MKYFHCILALFISAFSFGQVKLATTVEGKDFRIGEKIKVTFTLRIVGNDRIQETPLRTPDFSKFEVLNSGSDQNSIIDKETNEVANQIVVQYLLSPKVAGPVRIGSALVQVNGKMYKTEPIDLDIKEARIAEKPRRRRSLSINLEVQNTEVFLNEGTLAIVRAYSEDFNNFRNIHRVQLQPQEDLKVKAVHFDKGDIEQNPADNSVSQIVAMYMLYPEKSGTIELRPAKADFTSGENTSTLKSNSVNIKVKNLPAGSPKNYKNIVGDYRLDLYLPQQPDRIEVNKPLNLEIKISGDGNLKAADLPKLSASEAYSFYKPEIRKVNDKVWTENYVIIPKVAGDITVSTENFSFFNPKTRKYTDAGTSVLPLHVMSVKEVSNAKTTLESVNEFTNNVLETVNNPVIPTKKFRTEPRKKMQWNTVLGNYGIMALFAGILLILLYIYRRFFNTKKNGKNPKTENYNANTAIKKFEVQTHIQYLQRFLNEGKTNDFFKNLESTFAEAEEFVRAKYSLNFGEYLAQRHGITVADLYRKLSQKIHMERFAPQSTAEHLQDILSEANKIISLVE